MVAVFAAIDLRWSTPFASVCSWHGDRTIARNLTNHLTSFLQLLKNIWQPDLLHAIHNEPYLAWLATVSAPYLLFGKHCQQQTHSQLLGSRTTVFCCSYDMAWHICHNNPLTWVRVTQASFTYMYDKYISFLPWPVACEQHDHSTSLSYHSVCQSLCGLRPSVIGVYFRDLSTLWY